MTMPAANSNLQCALEYAQQGLRVFPLFYVLKDGSCSCRPRPNHPCKRVGKHPTTKNGVQDATTDEETIRRWWTETPWANIGLATGHNGLIVVDIDDGDLKKDGKVIGKKTGSASLQALIDQYGPLPKTRTIQTGSGGRHLYFASTQEITNSANRVGQFIDVRGYGGYVILPPSNHESGGRYAILDDSPVADMPDWLEARCMGSKVDISGDTLQEEVVADAREKKEATLTGDQLVRLLDFIPPDCDRDTWWQVGAALKKELGDKRGFEAWDAWSRKAEDKYDPKVMPVQWNSFTDKGITGGTIFHFAKTLGEFRGFDVEAADSDSFRKDWCFIAGIKRFVSIETLVEWDKEQFDAMHAPLFSRGKASEHVLRNPNFKRVNGATYWPEQPMWVNEYGLDKLNYWRPLDLTAQRGDVTPFMDHIEYLYPEKRDAKILLQYLAYQVQFPGQKVHWAVLLEGDQGNGKSYFASVMRRVLGQQNVKMVNNEALHETFTGWQRNTQLIIVEEMMAKARLELMNKLKPMITEPWCTIREMYRPPYEQPNRFNFLFFSNHRDSIIINSTDRRYCILKTNSPPHPKGNAGYYGPLFEWTRKNGPALLHYLKHEVDLSDFQPKAHAPMTEGKMALIAQSRMPLDAFIFEHVEAREYPFHWDLHNPSVLVEMLTKYNLRVNPKEIGNAFARLGFLELGRFREPGADKIRLWAVRDFENYREMNNHNLIQLWLMQQNDGIKPADEATIDALSKQKPKNAMLGREPM